MYTREPNEKLKNIYTTYTNIKGRINMMNYKERIKENQEKANELYKMNKNVDANKAAYYKGIWEALVWVQYDIEGELFE